MTSSRQILQIVRELNHSPARVFSALTDPAKMSQWFFGVRGGRVAASADLRPGGQYRLAMTGEGVNCTPRGTYLEIVPAKKLVFTWCSHDGDPETKVTIELSATAAGTKLVLTHELPPEAIEPHREGWNICFEHLGLFLDRATAKQPAAAS